MQDLHNTSSVAKELLPNEEVYALDVNSWATLKFVYEVTNSEFGIRPKGLASRRVSSSKFSRFC
jgi:hypothetical protein